ncbi:MAG: undecaprenyl-diphosphate phosphatase [Deltaproteobacteria bacterium]|nr:undecaprenyl-diphosphate phosphatase [Deltaproteobacteria bacterium]
MLVATQRSTLSAYGGMALLGVIQGLTEFLPVSSSGHLVIGKTLFGLAEANLLVDVMLHVGTLLPVLWLYRRDLWQMILSLGRLPSARRHWPDDGSLRLTLCVVVATLPTAAMGVGLKNVFEGLFSNTLAVGIALLCTGGILMLTRLGRQSDPQPHRTLSLGRALVVGVAQGAAITPGISRSGTTIAVGLLLGIEREMAARFSFVMSIPAILGAVVLTLRKAQGGVSAPLLALGVLTSALAGYLALRWVVALVRRGTLHRFSYYVWPLGIAVLVYTLM